MMEYDYNTFDSSSLFAVKFPKDIFEPKKPDSKYRNIGFDCPIEKTLSSEQLSGMVIGVHIDDNKMHIKMYTTYLLEDDSENERPRPAPSIRGMYYAYPKNGRIINLPLSDEFFHIVGSHAEPIILEEYNHYGKLKNKIEFTNPKISLYEYDEQNDKFTLEIEFDTMKKGGM